MPPIATPTNAGKPKYLGYYRVGPRVVFAYRLGDTEYLDAPWVSNGIFVHEVNPREQHSMAAALNKSNAADSKDAHLRSRLPFAWERAALFNRYH